MSAGDMDASGIHIQLGERKVRLPRIMLAAPASGSGKTLITCGILKALKNRGLKTASFKCGPDYIDPMFHREVLKIPARNLDTFFTDDAMTRYLFGRTAQQTEISVLEGVMGYYDGAGGDTTRASSCELARVTDTPVILVVNARGMSLSVVPLIRGFLEYQVDSRIAGVILNQISFGVYEKLKIRIEQELSLPVFGYVPKCPELVIESRHLGLVMPGEISDIQDKLQKLAELLEKTLEIDNIIACAQGAPELIWEEPEQLKGLKKSCLAWKNSQRKQGASHVFGEKKEGDAALRIGVARDQAFCFLYQDNLTLLEELGAELLYFSPLHDKALPKDLDGLLLCGGYPELYAKALSENESMRRGVRECIERGTPYLAECGGFLYLQKTLEDMEGHTYPMAGVFPGKGYRTEKLGRFGYITLTAKEEGQLLDRGDTIKAHEYHYYECTENGNAYHGRKPFGSREWDCMQGGRNFAAGFPHLYYYSNPGFVAEFLNQCREKRKPV